MHKKLYKYFMYKPIRNLFRIELIRFILIGILNTFGSYITYYFFLLFLNYLFSYILSMIFFIFFSSYLNTSFVFKLKPSKNALISFSILIIIQLLVGSLILMYAVEILLIPEKIAPLLNIFFITPIKYLTSKFLKRYFE